MTQDLLITIIEAIISIVIALIGAYVVPYLREKIGAAKLAQYKEWAKIGVEAAEQMFIGEKLGQERLEYVTIFLDGIINKNKEVLNKENIRTLIESALKEMKAIEK